MFSDWSHIILNIPKNVPARPPALETGVTPRFPAGRPALSPSPRTTTLQVLEVPKRPGVHPKALAASELNRSGRLNFPLPKRRAIDRPGLDPPPAREASTGAAWIGEALPPGGRGSARARSARRLRREIYLSARRRTSP